VLAALAPALMLETVALVLYGGAVAATAEPGVLGALMSGRSAVLLFLLGPLAALLGLQLVVLSSTRARDPRAAQQIGVLVVMPIVGMLVGQSAGTFWLTGLQLLIVAATLAALWLGLLALSAATFDGERVLTRWK
jgi:ABC-2 type transport system permease protein